MGDTIKEALVEAEINKELWLEAAKDIGKEIPLPTKIQGYKEFKENL